MIYLKLQGRIGNQLFMYAAARMVQLQQGDNQEIVIEDCNNIAQKYDTVLDRYSLDNVRFVHDLDLYRSPRMLVKRWASYMIKAIEIDKTPRWKYEFEKKHQGLFNKLGIIRAVDGYIDLPKKYSKDTYMYGFFQSERYFYPIRDEIKKLFAIESEVMKSGYPDLKKIQNRNTVCISIKVQHNVGNPMYDVCDRAYYEKAISIILDKVDNPLFFVCADNIQYVLENLIDSEKYDVVLQDSSYPIHLMLAIMSQSKHFIIGNTSFGWWAQYLSYNLDKIVIAPSKWYGIDVPCDIYQDDWILIDV